MNVVFAFREGVMEKGLVGEYLIRHRKITETQLQRALEIQAIRRKDTRLLLIGTVLVGMGAIQTDDLTFALAEQVRDRMRVSA
jgi:hypothetical protein